MCVVLAQECPGLARGTLEEGLPKGFPDMSENLPSRFLSRPCPRGEDDQGKHTCTYPYTHSHPHIFSTQTSLAFFLKDFGPSVCKFHPVRQRAWNTEAWAVWAIAFRILLSDSSLQAPAKAGEPWMYNLHKVANESPPHPCPASTEADERGPRSTQNKQTSNFGKFVGMAQHT